MKIAGSSALRGAILGAAVVGSLAALIGALMVPSGRLDFGWSEAFFMAVAGMTLGVTAGAVAGASEPRRKLVTFTKRLNEGKVLVIMEAVEGLPTATILELLTENGAVEVSVA